MTSKDKEKKEGEGESSWHRLQNFVNTTSATIQNTLLNPPNDSFSSSQRTKSSPDDSQLYQRNGTPSSSSSSLHTEERPVTRERRAGSQTGTNAPPLPATSLNSNLANSNVSTSSSSSTTTTGTSGDRSSTNSTGVDIQSGNQIESLSNSYEEGQSSSNSATSLNSPKKVNEQKAMNPNEAQRELKIQEFRTLFNLPNETPLLETRCALNEKILLQGRLHVTENYICFHSGIYKNSDKIIPFSEVTDLQKRYTAIVFPNGIEVRCAGDKIFNFSSFLSRDEVYNFIYNQWKNSWSKTPILKAKFEEMEREREILEEVQFGDKGVELSDLAPHSPAYNGRRSMDETSVEQGTSKIHHRRSNSNGEKEGGEQQVHHSKSNSAESTPLSAPSKQHRPSLEAKSKSASALTEKGNNSNAATPKKKEEKGIEPPVGGCSHSHVSDFSSSDYHTCETIQMDIDKFWKVFLRGNFWLEFQKAAGLIENVLGEWKLSSGGCCLERELNCVAPLNNRLGPKQTRIGSNHRVFYKSPTVMIFENSNISKDVPYGDAFLVKNIVQLTQNPDGKSITLVVASTIKWTKSAWGMKAIIEKFAAENNREFYVKAVEIIKQKVAKGDAAEISSSLDDSSSTLLNDISSSNLPLQSESDKSLQNEAVSFSSSVNQQNAPLLMNNNSINSSSPYVNNTSWILPVSIGFGIVGIIFVSMFLQISFLQKSLSVSMDNNSKLLNRIARMESYLESNSNGKFNATKVTWHSPQLLLNKLEVLRDQVRIVSSQLEEAKDEVYYSSGMINSLEESDQGFDWLFWSIGLALLIAAIFAIQKYKEKVVSFVAPPTPKIHAKED